MRDDFSQATIRKLAARVGYRCSCQDCPQLTIGPEAGGDGTVNIGKAAHITAASVGGPRYDASLTADQRRAQSNGIWLCANHADQIDRDAKKFTVEVLREWKVRAEQRALLALTSGRSAVLLPPSEIDQAVIAALSLGASENLDAVAARLGPAAQADIESFRDIPGFPQHPLPLTLELKATGTRHALDIPRIAAAMARWEDIAIVAPPGTGKTTTLTQLAGTVLSDTNLIPIIIPLSEWSLQSDRFLQSLIHRPAFRGFREEHFMLLALHGRLTLLLDGWNEVGADTRSRCIAELKRIQREFPLLGITVTTRRQALDVPINGRVVQVLPLSEAQQLELAKALRGDDGVKLLERAWRTPGIRSLVSIPLYLTALLSESTDASLPTTKEELLRLFIEQHEKAPEKAEAYNSELQGAQRRYLGALAVEGTASANSTITEVRSREVVTSVSTVLVASGQMSVAPQPAHVIDLLANHHTLVRTGGADRTISFQHQQIQEWFASAEVETAVLASAGGDGTATKKLRQDILNTPSWEESIFFAAERLSRRDTRGQAAIAHLVIEALTLDPMLAAEIIFRSTEEVWALVKPTVMELISRWHVPGHVDRAVRFMILSGRAEFADQAWALLSNPANQVHIETLRLGRFRPGVLGSDALVRLAALPAEIRGDIASEIIMNGGIEGIELIGDFAKTEQDPSVIAEIIQSFDFRHAGHWTKEFLKGAPDQVFDHLAEKGGISSRYADATALDKLADARKRMLQKFPNPLGEISAIADGDFGSSADDAISALIAKPDLDVEDSNASSAIFEASRSFPAATRAGLMKRLEAGLPLPYGSGKILDEVEPTDQGSIPAQVLSKDTARDIASDSARVIGPVTISTLIANLFEAHDACTKNPSQANRDEFHRIKDLIVCANKRSFAEAMIAYPSEVDPRRIGLLADLLARSGGDDRDGARVIPSEYLGPLAKLVEAWGKHLLAHPDATRHQFAEVARAAEQLAQPELLNALTKLLAEDLKRWKAARAAFRPGTGTIPADVSQSYTLQYGKAFEAIGDEQAVEAMEGYLTDPQFGLEAALVLKRIWLNRARERQRIFGARWPDYSAVKELRAKRARGEGGSCELAEPIFRAVDELLNVGDEASQQLALSLAGVAFDMPYTNKGGLSTRLLALPVPIANKRRLLLCLAANGEILEAEFILDGLKAFLTEAKTKSWLLDDGRQDLAEWLQLLAFSDRPGALLDGLGLIEPRHRDPRRLSSLVLAIADVPDDPEGLLLSLAKFDPKFTDHREWIEALLQIGTVKAVGSLLDCLDNDSLKMRGSDDWYLSQKLAVMAGKSAQIKRELEDRYRKNTKSRAYHMAERALSEFGDEETLVLLVRGYAAAGKKFDGQLVRAVERAVTIHEPVEGWSNAYEVVSKPATQLRKQLFAMYADGKAYAEIARDCLVYIDKLRDENRRPDLEPRHPDISTGKPWPLSLSPDGPHERSDQEEY